MIELRSLALDHRRRLLFLMCSPTSWPFLQVDATRRIWKRNQKEKNNENSKLNTCYRRRVHCFLFLVTFFPLRAWMIDGWSIFSNFNGTSNNAEGLTMAVGGLINVEGTPSCRLKACWSGATSRLDQWLSSRLVLGDGPTDQPCGGASAKAAMVRLM